MTAFDRLKSLCEKNKISINDLEEKLGIGKNSLYSWKKGIPKGTNLIKVADYFNVSTDYLLGREATETPTETDLNKMIEGAMSFDGEPMTENDKEIILAYLKGKYGK